jgi:hypothetical protein
MGWSGKAVTSNTGLLCVLLSKMLFSMVETLRAFDSIEDEDP